jgi:hypothetical protein
MKDILSQKMSFVTSYGGDQIMLAKRAEIELAALGLGYRSATIRKRFSRGSIPAKAQLKLNAYFGQPVSVKEFSARTLADRCLSFACR